MATSNAVAQLTAEDMSIALCRHGSEDWGEVCPEDREANDTALIGGFRIRSAYKSANGVEFWIITEWDRSATMVLLPEDY